MIASVPTYIFAGGGTGGHLFPALAVADRLTEICPQARVIFACSNRDIDLRVLYQSGYAMIAQSIRPLPRGALGWGKFITSWVRSDRLAHDLIRDLRPAAVFGLGGFAAVPIVRAAVQAGVRTCLLSIDSVPGVANKYLAGRVETVFAQFAATVPQYGSNQSKVRVIGCPVRKEIAAGDSAEGRKHFGLRDDRRTLLVMAGSLGANNINTAVAALVGDLDALADTWQVLHVTGPGKLAEVTAAWGDAPMGVRTDVAIGHTVLEFCDRMDLAYAASDLVLCRAGASTVGELAATATPAVLMPYPYHRDQHQKYNAQTLVDAGSAVVVTDTTDTAQNAASLRQALVGIMREPLRLSAMREWARRSSGPDAAGEIAHWLAGLKVNCCSGR